MSVLAFVLARALAVLLALLTGATQAAPPEASAPVESLRQEHLLIELVRPGEGLDPLSDRSAGRPVGFALLRRRDSTGRRQLELDLTFPDPEGDEVTRVLHVEQLGRGASRLVWREWRPRDGRSMRLEPGDGARGTVSLVERGRREPHREELTVPAGGLLPLELIEALRESRPPTGPLAVFDPLSRRYEPLLVSRGDGPGHQRTYELRRADGSLAGRYRFDGERLLGLQWQDGGLRARRVEPAEWERARSGASASPAPSDSEM